MIPTAESVLKIAASYIGYCEKKTNAYLYDPDFTKNKGSNNYSMFGKDVSTPRYWNGNKNGADWCTSFVCCCILYAAGGKPNGGSSNEKYYADVKATQPYTSLGGSCYYQTNKYKSAKRFFSAPQVGDQAFFSRGHTGLVERVDGSTITLIEGNSNNKVERRTYKFPNSIFSGFGRPYYKASSNVPASTVLHMVVSTDTPERIARRYGITVQALLDANKAKYPRITKDFIVDGWKLIIPVLTHKVVSTDTPEKIAKKYGITTKELLDANKAKYPTITIDFIRDGWELVIPKKV